MKTHIITVSIPIPKTPEKRAQDYIDRVERRRRRNEARTARRIRKLADDLFNYTLGAFSLFVVLTILMSI